ncbi:hypothetical protein [Fodinibius halophilus]|uniref:Uncharacterized protein n=1 Tax=Fodinibius halophilus TaxID=1736908 RepID=A0A6M1T7D5_9BACT|nr:hypothetical protein [Fodinibius halophilus]NGP90019.1 hypothetical protein [Fodinibius halophilus]
MKDTEKTNLQKALDNFITELKELSEAYPESDFNDYLIEEVVPALTEDDQLYSTSVFSKLEVAIILSQSELKNKSYSLERAINFMNVDAICWLLDHIYTLNHTMETLNLFARGTHVDKSALSDRARQLKVDRNELQKWINRDLFERIQGYENDIKELQGGQ